MTTTTVRAKGSDWSADTLYEPGSWGHDTTNNQANQLGDLVVDLFHKHAQEAGSSAYWSPETSEVTCNTDDQTSPEQLSAWREQAESNVWTAVTDENSDSEELTRAVALIFEHD